MSEVQTPPPWFAGAGKAIITGYVPHIGMMGYGMHFNTVKGTKSELYVRTLLVKHASSGQLTAIINAETCFISLAVRAEVLCRLRRHHPQIGLSYDNLLLTAQHTHSGPGGYSHYGFYNLSIPGFVPQVFNAIVSGILASIVQAWAALQPAHLFFSSGAFDENQQVAFNRSLAAYNSNPEVAARVPVGKEHLALDRTMKLLLAESPSGVPIGMFTWFAVHPTNVHNDNHLITADNKGYAASITEEAVRINSGSPTFIAAFAQGSAGDVSPNYWFDRKKQWTRGKFEDDFASAEWNGRQQAELALSICSDKRNRTEIQGDLDFGMAYSDFSNVVCHPDFTGNEPDAQTSPACFGVSFFAGTAEGPGMPGSIAFMARGISTLLKGYERFIARFQSKERRERMLRKYQSQYPKHILVEAGERRILATSDVKNLILPSFLDKSLGTFKEQHRRGALNNKPWVPQVLPLQIVILGHLAMAAIPAETTTIAGARLRDTALHALRERGITEVILCPYANAYCGYVTTHQEYMLQLYEGGHTMFGKWTLAAFQTRLRELARELLKPTGQRNNLSDAEPDYFTEEDLKYRTYNPGPSNPAPVSLSAAGQSRDQQCGPHPSC